MFLRKQADGKIKFAFSNASADTPKEELLRASTMRWSIEQLFQEGKGYLGMDHYETRSYPGWYRHMTLVILIMHFCWRSAWSSGKKNYITLPLARQLLFASLTGDPQCVMDTIKTVCYLFRRAEIARISHRKKVLEAMRL
ncbi:MAG: hypothetical protein KGZ79_00245 [Dethiobacter sp.]|nr:hypothetical protein [Dethiobacter sp.]